MDDGSTAWRRFGGLGLGGVFFVAACSGSSTTPAPAGDGASMQCGADWAAECRRQNCDPSEAAWQSCKINGWSSYVAAPHCDANSGYAGDDEALCVPAADEGLQLHFGPADYDDPAEVTKYVLEPGGETYDCTFDSTANVAGKYAGQYVARSRPGAHHVQMTYAAPADTTPAKTTRACNLGVDLLGTANTFMAIAQSSELSTPDLTIPKPEGVADDGGLDFEGSANPLEAGRMLQLLSHYLNTSDQPILKEAWFNVYYRDVSDVKAALYTISLISGGISVPPHSTETFRRSCSTDVERDVKYLQGHSHLGNNRISIWHAGGEGQKSKVYESYDPLEPATLAFSALVKNRVPDPTRQIAGGASGPLLLGAGDSLVWECEFDNQTDNTVGDGDPNPKFFGQMCYTYGAFAAPLGEAASNWVCGATMPTAL
jgi:hypothetical protein